jgi:hypothetical protein
LRERLAPEGCFSPLIPATRYKGSTAVSDRQLLPSFPMEAVFAVSYVAVFYVQYRTAGLAGLFPDH